MGSLARMHKNERLLTNDEEICLVNILVGRCHQPYKNKLTEAVHCHYYSLSRNRDYWKKFILSTEGMYFQEKVYGERTKELHLIRQDILSQVEEYAK